MSNKPRKLTPIELENQLDMIVQFLSSVHPNLNGSSGYRPSVELRPLVRGVPKDDRSYFSLTWSLNIWDLSEENVERIRKFLMRHNGQQTCLFYSVFTYDNNKKVHTKEGVPAKFGKITTKAALFAEELALDFDNIGFEEYMELVDRFEELGIYALWTSSGHGYQTHILLNEPLDDKTLLRKFVYKFRSKGFFCDSKCVDPARVMRLPGTFNNKCFVDEQYADEQSAPPQCVMVQDTTERYSLDVLNEKLNTLPTVSVEDEQAYLSITTEEEAPVIPEPNIPVMEEDFAVLKRIEYPYISDFELPLPLEKMLKHTPKGYRNHALGFMIRFFKNQFKLSKKQIMDILQIWSENACVPTYEPNEFKEDFTRLYYNYKGLPYDPVLAKKFGNINFGELVQLRKKNVIHIPNRVFRDLSELGGKELRLYLGIKMLEHVGDETTQEKLSKLLNISDRAIRPTLQNLVKKGHCFVKKGNSRQGIPNTYHSSYLVSSEDGYMTFTYNDIAVYTKELCEQTGRTRANAELVLYLFFRWKFFSGEIYMSQSNLGKHTGITQAAVSQVINRLQERHFIKVRKIRRNSFVESCEYTLLR